MFKSPKATVGAVLFHPNGDRSKILLTKRNIEPFKDYWCFPGGHVEENEKLIKAVEREIKEETNLSFKPTFLHYFEEIFPDKSIHNVALFYYGKAYGIENKDAVEVSEMRWFTLKEAQQLKLAFNHNNVLNYYLDTIVKNI